MNNILPERVQVKIFVFSMTQVVEVVEVNFTDQEANQSNQITGDSQVQVLGSWQARVTITTYIEIVLPRILQRPAASCRTIQESGILFSYNLTINKWCPVDRNSLERFIRLTLSCKDGGEKK